MRQSNADEETDTPMPREQLLLVIGKLQDASTHTLRKVHVFFITFCQFFAESELVF
jgi:hypothetical protein